MTAACNTKRIGSSEIVYKSPDVLRQEAKAIAQSKRDARIGSE